MNSAPVAPHHATRPFRFPIRFTITDLPIPRKLALIMGPFCVVALVLLALSYFGMTILSGSRAYVGGEASYSKAQKNAVNHLMRYALFREEIDYQEALRSLSVPLGDHDARMELAKENPDNAVIVRGFLQGRIHLEDIPSITWMAKHLGRFYYMRKAIHFWSEADDSIQGLAQMAAALHQELASPQVSASRVRRFVEEIQQLDERLAPLEDQFSSTLGEGGRWLKRTLLLAMFVATFLCLGTAFIISFLISRHLCDEIDRLRLGASRIASGDYSLSLDVESNDEIGELARTFGHMAEQRQEAERLKNAFFANVSHELRTPLTLILSPLESVLGGDFTAAPAKTKESLQIAHNNAVRLLQIVNGLLDFTKLEDGKLLATREPVRLSDLTEMVYKDFLPLIHASNLLSRLDLNCSSAVVMMDRYFFERILFNLLSNAVKFTPNGGKIEVRQSCSGGRMTLTVTDSGVGIPDDQHEKIFKRFHQVEGSSTRRFEGTGLGLALVKELTELLGGSVTVESRVGAGSTFTVICPAPLAAANAEVKAHERSAVVAPVQRYSARHEETEFVPPPSNAPRPKVLIAEDNRELATYIQALLQPFCQAQIAEDGDDAYRLATEWSPDLILSDVMMPKRDGLALCRDIRANARTAAIPIVILTALTHRDALLEGWKAGANDYLYKPFHPKELVIRIQSLLKVRSDQKHAEEKIMHLNESLQRHSIELTAANKELEAFSYSVSHDLRAPLRAIDGFGRELQENHLARLDDRGKSDLSRIRAATIRMGQLIDDLLELSHLSRYEIKRESVDLSAQAGEIVSELRSENPARQIDVVIQPEITGHGDPRLLRVAMQNLLQNAWKFTQHRDQARLEFGVQTGDGKPAYFVRDNGAGFNMEYAATLFRPFQRFHHVEDFPGTGIGLALVRRIVQRHGGKIWADAKEDIGATFYFTLP